MSGRCAGQRWLVTGGTRGLGRALVRAVVQEGGHVVTCGRTAAEVEGATALAADVGDEADVDRLFDQAVERLGGLDVVVNNAGILHDALLVSTPLDRWQAVLGTNLRGAWLVARRAVDELLGGGQGGCIVNVASAAANGLAGQAAYAASKAGLLSMSRAIAKEYGPRRIRCNAVVPGFFASDMTAGLDPARRHHYEDLSPERRFGTDAEFVEAVLFLASSDASFVTGDELWVCGGAREVPPLPRSAR